MIQLGQTRSAHRPDHLLHTPDTFVRTPLPGLTGGLAIIHAAPALGAAFTQYTVELEAGGVLASSAIPDLQRFVYIVSGTVDLASEATFRTLSPTAFACLPPGMEHVLTASAPAMLQVIEKPYSSLSGYPPSGFHSGVESDIPPVPLQGDPDLLVRSLMTPGLGSDFAVNTMTYAPGSSLAQVEVHVMEHGLYMLEGGGIYRLNDRWYPVTAGDFIWMAPFCPQWFGAMGKTPAKYLIYKDFNRHPMV